MSLNKTAREFLKWEARDLGVNEQGIRFVDECDVCGFRSITRMWECPSCFRNKLRCEWLRRENRLVNRVYRWVQGKIE